jgi:3-hydroxybutyryl-CoA dehydrogenase
MFSNKNGTGTERRHEVDPASFPAGVIGLGMMGVSITACLLAAGHSVVGVTRNLEGRSGVAQELKGLLRQMVKQGLLRKDPALLLKRFHATEDFRALRECKIVIESIVESAADKKAALRNVEEVVSAETIIGTNTSAIPVTIFQEGASVPERILGIHWAEPAHVTRFMEIICGRASSLQSAELVVALARHWGKEPSLLRKDIRGFITNRLAYALFREAFHLVESGYATIEDVDRSMRNDLGYWITFAGPFRFMDLTGIPAYASVMKDLWPELSNATEVPDLIKKVVDAGGRGTANHRGFYNYTPEQAKRWEQLFLKFTYEIRALALKYPEDIGDRASKPQKPARRSAKSSRTRALTGSS